MAAKRERAAGFSLIEAAAATIILGLGVAALLSAVAAGTRAHGAGREITHATTLAQEVREWTLKLPFYDPQGGGGSSPGSEEGDPQSFVDDLDDLMDVTFCPPRDGQGLPITDMTGWSQTITLSWRDVNNLTSTVTAGTSDAVEVQVQVRHNQKTILTTEWLVVRRD